MDAYTEEKLENGDERTFLKLNPILAPFTVAVFPLLANKPQLTERARLIYKTLQTEGFRVTWDDRGNIGKRYSSQDEIGTPWAVTVDFQSLEDGTVTLRDRDSMEQKRVPIDDVPQMLRSFLKQAEIMQ
jgi:glycyl-tRNA synthetase